MNNMSNDKIKEKLNDMGKGMFPELLGIEIIEVSKDKIVGELEISAPLLAPNGYLHAASVVGLADTCCGYGTMINLSDKAIGFTTIELKSNHLGTALKGILQCIATPQHIGGSTQVWDAKVIDKDSKKNIALFRCTQMILKK